MLRLFSMKNLSSFDWVPAAILLALASGCADASDSPRPELSRAECTASGGMVIGDIGNGAIHEPDYRCSNGKPPLGTIVPQPGEPIAIEGEVCCGQ